MALEGTSSSSICKPATHMHRAGCAYLIMILIMNVSYLLRDCSGVHVSLLITLKFLHIFA